MGEPVGEQEGLFLREVAVVEDEQELAPASFQALDRVRDAGPEVPEVAFAHIVLEGATVLVNGGDPGPALEHVSPLGRLVPVQFPDAASLEPHADAGDLGGDGEFPCRRLTAPAAGG